MIDSTLSAILRRENCQLEDILQECTEKGVDHAIRVEHKELFDFLFADQNLERLIQYVLTNDFQYDANLVKMQSMAMSILTNRAKSYQDRLIDSSIFMDYVTQFPQTSNIEDWKICGNYAKLLESIIISTCGEVLSTHFQFLDDLLIDHMHISSFKELFIMICTDYTDQFHFSLSVILQMISKLGDINACLPIISVMQRMIKVKNSMVSFYDSYNVVATLFDHGIKYYHDHPILSVEIFNLINEIILHSMKDEVQTIMHNYVGKLHINGEWNCATAAALNLFPDQLSTLIIPFLNNQLNTILNESIYNVISQFHIKLFATFITENHLNHLIVQYYPTYVEHKTNGHFLELCRIIKESNVVCCEEHKEEWKKLLIVGITDRISTREKMIGFSQETKQITDSFLSMSSFAARLQTRV